VVDIDILVPVLSRPANVKPLVDSIHAATTMTHRIIFLTTHGDDTEIAACVAIKGAEVITTLPEENSYAKKINLGASLFDGTWLFLGADDLHFHKGWDHEAIAEHERTGKLVIGTNDLGNPTVVQGKHATHSLVHRDYLALGTIDEPGKLLHEGYCHNFTDTEFCGTAKHRDQFAFAFASHVEHRHWLWGKGKDDPTYELGRVQYRADSRTFAKRRRLWR
jgi:Glycosyltransferases involved in cell wall biogenesis